jgi:hypothetical protein
MRILWGVFSAKSTALSATHAENKGVILRILAKAPLNCEPEFKSCYAAVLSKGAKNTPQLAAAGMNLRGKVELV